MCVKNQDFWEPGNPFCWPGQAEQNCAASSRLPKPSLPLWRFFVCAMLNLTITFEVSGNQWAQMLWHHLNSKSQLYVCAIHSHRCDAKILYFTCCWWIFLLHSKFPATEINGTNWFVSLREGETSRSARVRGPEDMNSFGQHKQHKYKNQEREWRNNIQIASLIYGW